MKRMKKQTKSKDIALALHQTLANRDISTHFLQSLSLEMTCHFCWTFRHSLSLSLALCVCVWPQTSYRVFFSMRKSENTWTISRYQRSASNKKEDKKRHDGRKKERKKRHVSVWRDAMTGVWCTAWMTHIEMSIADAATRHRYIKEASVYTVSSTWRLAYRITSYKWLGRILLWYFYEN